MNEGLNKGPFDRIQWEIAGQENPKPTGSSSDRILTFRQENAHES